MFTAEQSAELRKALESTSYCRKHPAGRDRIAECHHAPSVVDLKLTVCNAILQAHGVEYIAHRDDTYRETCGLSYVNMGETYAATILYDHRSDRFLAEDWGSIVERRPGQYG